MEWVFGLAVLPLLMCGAMCLGGAVFAVLGFRRRRERSCHPPAPSDHRASVDEVAEAAEARVQRP